MKLSTFDILILKVITDHYQETGEYPSDADLRSDKGGIVDAFVQKNNVSKLITGPNVSYRGIRGSIGKLREAKLLRNDVFHRKNYLHNAPDVDRAVKLFAIIGHDSHGWHDIEYDPTTQNVT